MVANLAQAAPVPLDLRLLDYLSPSLRTEAASKSLAKAKSMMPAPRAIETRCTQCGECVAACPVGAISGEKKKPHLIDQELCIQCGSCRQACKFDAVLVE